MLSRLILTDFRNHADLTLSPGPGFVVLTGANGAGKTNILEAVSLLAPGRGLRRVALSDMARQGGAGGFGVAATLDGGRDAAVEIATGAVAAAPERRVARVPRLEGQRQPIEKPPPIARAVGEQPVHRRGQPQHRQPFGQRIDRRRRPIDPHLPALGSRC